MGTKNTMPMDLYAHEHMFACGEYSKKMHRQDVSKFHVNNERKQ